MTTNLSVARSNRAGRTISLNGERTTWVFGHVFLRFLLRAVPDLTKRYLALSCLTTAGGGPERHHARRRLLANRIKTVHLAGKKQPELQVDGPKFQRMTVLADPSTQNAREVSGRLLGALRESTVLS